MRHGLRHHYAQWRYKYLIGWRSFHPGGTTRNELDDGKKAMDIDPRQIISRELGHERLQTVATYIGQ